MPRSKIVRDTTEELKEFERRGQTKTDGKRVKAMRDEDIIIDEDSPEITAEMWRNVVVTGGQWRRIHGKSTSISS